MARITVLGRTLAGLAAAARLAKAGHDVTLVGDEDPHERLPPVLLLPAPWRDLLRKSGRAFTDELSRHGLELEPAPPAVHRFADGLELVWPTNRGEQTRAVRERFGDHHARAWTALLDEYDEVWQACRRHGLERPRGELAKADRRALRSRTTVGELARRLEEAHLAELLLSSATRAGATDPHRAPAMLVTRLCVERTFGRWQLVEDGQPASSARLLDVLHGRLDTRRVARAAEPPTEVDVELDTRPPTPPVNRLFKGRTLLAVRPPKVTHEPADLPPRADAGSDIHELVVHDGTGHPRVTWTRPRPDGAEATTHDFAATTEPDPAWGWSVNTFKKWAARPAIATNDASRWLASAASPGGNEPWAELLAGALATYEIHESLTGEDIRPTNRGRRA